MERKCAVVEFQAFRGERNEYIVKEFAIVDIKTYCSIVIQFAPPYEHSRLPVKTQKTNEWLQRHYHRLSWDDGNVPYTELMLTIVDICSHFSVLYTKGLEKTNFLRQYHGNVIDLNDLFAPCVSRSFFSSIMQCPVSQHQQKHAQCALHNALFYASWRREKEKIDHTSSVSGYKHILTLLPATT